MEAAEWTKAAEEFLIPLLPAGWKVRGAVVYKAPVEWLLCSLTMTSMYDSREFGMQVGVQLTAVPLKVFEIDLPSAERWGNPTESWVLPENIGDCQGVMDGVAEVVLATSFPFFDRYAFNAVVINFYSDQRWRRFIFTEIVTFLQA